MGPATNFYHSLAAARPINSLANAKFLPLKNETRQLVENRRARSSKSKLLDNYNPLHTIFYFAYRLVAWIITDKAGTSKGPPGNRFQWPG
jgi:hypothetical protein